MNNHIKRKLILTPLIVISVGIVIAIFIFNFIPYQLSKISFLNGNEIVFPSILLYMLIFGFTFKPFLNLIENFLLIRKCESGHNPSCPICSYPMVNRLAKRGKYIGQEFWGCHRFPKCSGKIHIG